MKNISNLVDFVNHPTTLRVHEVNTGIGMIIAVPVDGRAPAFCDRAGTADPDQRVRRKGKGAANHCAREIHTAVRASVVLRRSLRTKINIATLALLSKQTWRVSADANTSSNSQTIASISLDTHSIPTSDESAATHRPLTARCFRRRCCGLQLEHDTEEWPSPIKS